MEKMPTFEEFRLRVLHIAAETGADKATTMRALAKVLEQMKNKK